MKDQRAKKEGIGKILWLALICAPAVWFIGNIIMILIGSLENLVARVPWGGAWLFIPAYIGTLVYLIYRPGIRNFLKGIEW